MYWFSVCTRELDCYEEWGMEMIHGELSGIVPCLHDNINWSRSFCYNIYDKSHELSSCEKNMFCVCRRQPFTVL